MYTKKGVRKTSVEVGTWRKKVDGGRDNKMTRHDKPDDRREDGARSIVTGKAGLAHACEYEGERMTVEARGGRGDRGGGAMTTEGGNVF